MKESISFNSMDGTLLEGVFEKNKGDLKAGFLLLHGCPSYKEEFGFYGGNPNAFMLDGGMAEFLSARNVASLRFNYRDQGEGIKAEQMQDLTISGMISDTEAAYRLLRNKIGGSVPVYIVATSFAGGLAIRWLNIYNPSVKKLFLMCPLIDTSYTIRKCNLLESVHGLEQLKKEFALELKEKGYFISNGKKVNKAFLNEALQSDMIHEIKRLAIETIVYHGTIDDFVPYEKTIELMPYFKKGILITLEDARHGFGGPKDENGKHDINIKHRNQQFIFDDMWRRL